MLDFFNKIPLFYLALMASAFTYLLTALGAATVFVFKKVSQRIMDVLMGFAAGVMIAASFFSLLSPAVELSAQLGYITWLYPCLGFLLGGCFVVGASKLLDRAINLKHDSQHANTKRSILLVSSITLHNIPEGLSVGVAFGAVALGVPGCEIIGAVLLAMGIGIQNFPEGASVSLPLRRDGASRGKAFFLGQASGLVEPVAAIIGFFLATAMRAILPFALSFSAGAMISVVASELIPESTRHNKNAAVLGCIIGFCVMMLLDIALS